MKEIDLTSIKVELLAENGLGYGDGKISYAEAVKNGELLPEVDAYAREILTSGECLVPIEENDDGCIDGRQADAVDFPDPAGEGVVKKPILGNDQVHERAKVPGGGGPVRLLMWFAAGKPLGDNIVTDMRKVAEKAAIKGQPCGVHNGHHLSESTCDCGALDHLPAIMDLAIGKYREKIATGVEAISSRIGTSISKETFDRAMSGWQEARNDKDYFRDANGKELYGAITDGIMAAQAKLGGKNPVAVSKHLSGDHRERYIVLDTTPDMITSQNLFRSKLQEHFPNLSADNLPDFFSVTVPRIEQIAEVMSHNDREMEGATLASGLAQTLATAAKLTDGSLPVYIVRPD